MHTIIAVQYLFYIVAIALHASYAIVVAVLTEKGLLVEFDGNYVLVVLGVLGALLLTLIFLFAVKRYRKKDYFAVPDGQFGLIFLFMLSETVYCVLAFNSNNDLDCHVDTYGDPNPCVFRPLIFGLIFTASILLIVYVIAILTTQLTCPRISACSMRETGNASAQELGQMPPHFVWPLPHTHDKPPVDVPYTPRVSLY